MLCVPLNFITKNVLKGGTITLFLVRKQLLEKSFLLIYAPGGEECNHKRSYMLMLSTLLGT